MRPSRTRPQRSPASSASTSRDRSRPPAGASGGERRRAEIGFGGFDAWTERVYDEDARAAEKLDAKLRLELHWLQRGVTARRRRNQGRLAKLHEMRAQRAAMLGTAGTARLALARDDVRSKTVIDAERVSKSYPVSGSGAGAE